MRLGLGAGFTDPLVPDTVIASVFWLMIRTQTQWLQRFASWSLDWGQLQSDDLERAFLGGSVSGPKLTGLGSKLSVGFGFAPYMFIPGPRLKETCFYSEHAYLKGSPQSDRVKPTAQAQLRPLRTCVCYPSVHSCSLRPLQKGEEPTFAEPYSKPQRWGLYTSVNGSPFPHQGAHLCPWQSVAA